MKIIRNAVFETNSSSTHTLVIDMTNSKPKYTLTDKGYLLVNFEDYYYECKYPTFYTVNDKINFVFTMLMSFIFEKKWIDNVKKGVNNHSSYPYVTRNDFMKDKYVQEIQNLVINKLPNCKGIRFKKGSFDNEGHATGGMDEHHFQGCHSFEEYLKKSGVSLENLILNPNILICMNR